MSSTPFSFESADGLRIAGQRWDPDGSPVAAVQVTHGMGEHVLRYEELAQELTGAGFVVYGQDHRGHGGSALPGAEGDLGPGGWPALVADIGLLNAKIRSSAFLAGKTPYGADLPVFLLAHSMGSFAAQQYLLDHSADVDGVILTGTGSIDLLEPALDLDQPLDLSLFNLAFQPARTDFDWLTRDEAIVDAYISDPMCGFGIDTASGKAMFAGARRLADPAEVAAMRPDLPLYIAAGEKDPVNGGLTLLTALTDRYRAAGLTDVTVQIYPDARHEILNETNRAEVVAALIAWLRHNLGSR
jgi:alpha-beta hydrolase superfamily lysophospholipase